MKWLKISIKHPDDKKCQKIIIDLEQVQAIDLRYVELVERIVCLIHFEHRIFDILDNAEEIFEQISRGISTLGKFEEV